MSDEVRDDLQGAGISPRQRLERIEALLERIDGRLDSKASASDVIALELRVRDLEQSGGERVSEMRERVGGLDADLQVIGRKLAYATGTLATVIVVSEVLLVQVLRGG